MGVPSTEQRIIPKTLKVCEGEDSKDVCAMVRLVVANVEVENLGLTSKLVYLMLTDLY